MTNSDPLRLEVRDRIATITINRPPVNAFNLDAYRTLGELTVEIERRDDVSVVVLTADPAVQCWCGGADLNDFVGITAEDRQERYRFINGVLPGLLRLDRPVIAAINGPAVGVGVLLAAVCDLRVASESSWFSTPELKYGLIAGSSRLLNYLGMPEALVREMAYTARRVPAEALLAAGFLNRVVPQNSVLEVAYELATSIADVSLPALRARKRAFVQHETLDWFAAYELAQGLSKDLVEHAESRRGVDNFFSPG